MKWRVVYLYTPVRCYGDKNQIPQSIFFGSNNTIAACIKYRKINEYVCLNGCNLKLAMAFFGDIKLKNLYNYGGVLVGGS